MNDAFADDGDVQAARLQKTVSKLQLALAKPAPTAINSEANLEATLAQLRGLLAREATASAPAASTAPLRVLQVSVGSSIRMVPLDEVLYFEAADKYVRVLTAGHEYLIRTPLKELIAQLDAQLFWQVHRSVIVNHRHIQAAVRVDEGQMHLTLRGRPETITASRLYAHLFKGM